MFCIKARWNSSLCELQVVFTWRRKMSHVTFEPKLEEEVDALVGRSGASKPKIMKIIGETICEKYAWALITGKRPAKQAFDLYYTQKHELAKRKLIQRLCSELQKAKGLVPKGTTIFTPKDHVRKYLPDSCPTEPVEVSPSQRTMFLFMDWNGKESTWGAPVFQESFEKFIKEIQLP